MSRVVPTLRGVDSRQEHSRAVRIRISLLCGALALFALLYVPQPVLPQLADEFSVSAGTVALLVSASTLGLAAAAVPLGTLSDVIGRRSVMVTSLLVAEALALLLPLVGNFPLMVALRLVQGAAVAGVSTVALAYLGEEARGPQFGTTMGLYIAGNTIGGMAGRLLGGVLGDFFGWKGGIFSVALLAAVCTAVFVALLPKERHHQPKPARVGPLLAGLRASVQDRVLRGPYLVALLGSATFVAVYNALTFRLISPPLNIPPALAALAFLAYAAGTVTSALAGRAADKWGRAPITMLGVGVAVVGLWLTMSAQLWVILLGLVLFTGGFFAAHAVASGWVGAEAPASARGQASAVYQFCYYAGNGIGGIFGGIAYGAWGWSGMVAILTVWLACSALAVWRVRIRQRKAEPVAVG